MNLLTKITTAKTSTLVIVTLALSVWTVFIPWISFAIGDLSNWLLSTAALSGPYRFSDKKLFDLLENIYRAWWDIGVQFFCVLTVVQLLIIIPLGFYLSRILYRRYQLGVVRLWQFCVPVIILSLAVAFTTAVLYLSYIEVSIWRAEAGQIDVIDSAGALEDIPEWNPFS